MMAADTGDDGWRDKATYKSLILEHHMAAGKFGFSGLYTPLNDSGMLRSIRDTGLFKVGSRVDDLLVEHYGGEDQKVIPLRTALSAPFSELVVF